MRGSRDALSRLHAACRRDDRVAEATQHGLGKLASALFVLDQKNQFAIAAHLFD
jgi:hypothetical protein